MNQLAVIDFETTAGDELLIRGLSQVDWMLGNVPNLRRMFRGNAINFSLQPRLFLLAPRFSLQGEMRSAASREPGDRMGPVSPGGHARASRYLLRAPRGGVTGQPSLRPGSKPAYFARKPQDSPVPSRPPYPLGLPLTESMELTARDGTCWLAYIEGVPSATRRRWRRRTPLAPLRLRFDSLSESRATTPVPPGAPFLPPVRLQELLDGAATLVDGAVAHRRNDIGSARPPRGPEPSRRR